MVRVKKVANKNDIRTKSKRKEKSEKALKYQKYLKSKEWKEIRKLVIERDEGRCRCCGREAGDDGCTLTIHHSMYVTKDGKPILYNETEGDNLKYLITLCNKCHSFGIHKVRANYKRFAMD